MFDWPPRFVPDAPPASAMMYRASSIDAIRIDVPMVKSAPVFVLLNVLNEGPAFGTTQLPLVAGSGRGRPVVALIGCGTRASSRPINRVPETDRIVTPAPPEKSPWNLLTRLSDGLSL